MKNIIIVTSITLATLFLSSCSNMGRLQNMMENRGEVLKKYEKGNDNYMIIREGDRVSKYRLYSWSAGLSSGAQAESIYSIDTLIQTCAKGAQSQAPIDCQVLKRDPDFKEYINW